MSDEPKGETIEVKPESDYLQKVWKGQGPAKVTGRDDPPKGGKR